jgi:hypothetical protein
MRKLVLGVFALGVLTLAAPAGTAFADAGGAKASCMGFEASGISPPGSSDEIPDGMPGLKAFIDQTFPGVPPGLIFETIAQLQEGSHEACDEALEG